jgi:hypothetical protein
MQAFFAGKERLEEMNWRILSPGNFEELWMYLVLVVFLLIILYYFLFLSPCSFGVCIWD